MSTVTAEYLRSLPEQIIKRRIDNEVSQIIGSFMQTLQRNAGEGKTFYLYEIPSGNNMMQHSQIIPLTPDQLIAAFQEKFPGCAISYKETWIDTNANTRIFKKGIMIDWSL